MRYHKFDKFNQRVNLELGSVKISKTDGGFIISSEDALSKLVINGDMASMETHGGCNKKIMFEFLSACVTYLNGAPSLC